MPAAQRAAYVPLRVAENSGAPPTGALPELPKPWPYISDDFYPITEGSLINVPERVAKLDRDWKARIGAGTAEPSARIMGAHAHMRRAVGA